MQYDVIVKIVGEKLEITRQGVEGEVLLDVIPGWGEDDVPLCIRQLCDYPDVFDHLPGTLVMAAVEENGSTVQMMFETDTKDIESLRTIIETDLESPEAQAAATFDEYIASVSEFIAQSYDYFLLDDLIYTEHSDLKYPVCVVLSELNARFGPEAWAYRESIKNRDGIAIAKALLSHSNIARLGEGSDMLEGTGFIVDSLTEGTTCWFCGKADEPLKFDIGFDTGVHISCLVEALKAEPDHPEAKHMMYLLSPADLKILEDK